MENRVKWIQVAKGLGIILVVLGHTSTTVLRERSAIAMNIYNYIYFFHMAFFFYISGRTYALSKSKKASKHLLIPFIFYASVVYIIFLFLNMIPATKSIAISSGYEIQPIGTWILSLVLGTMKYTSHLWFIYALFLIQMLTKLIENIFKNKANHVCLFISLLFIIISQLIYIPEVEIVNRCMLLYIWFVIGKLFDVSRLNVGAVIICGIIGNIYWGVRYLAIPNMEINQTFLLRYVDQIIKITFIIMFIKLATIITGKIQAILTYLGNNSFNIYILHQPFLCSTVSVLLTRMIAFDAIIIIFITFFIALIGTLVLVKILKIRSSISKLLLGIR